MGSNTGAPGVTFEHVIVYLDYKYGYSGNALIAAEGSPIWP